MLPKQISVNKIRECQIAFKSAAITVCLTVLEYLALSSLSSSTLKVRALHSDCMKESEVQRCLMSCQVSCEAWVHTKPLAFALPSLFCAADVSL